MNLNRSFVLTLIFVVAAIIAPLWWTNRVVTPAEATWEDVLAEAETGGYRLITTSALAENYSRSGNDIFLVDTRQDWEYRAGRIKGAVNFPMEPTWWSRWRKADSMKELLGPDKNRTVVFY